MKKIFCVIAVASLVLLGCGSDDHKDVKSNPQPSAQNTENEQGAPSESDDGESKPVDSSTPSNPSNPGASGNDGAGQPPSGGETERCEPECREGLACINGSCVTPTDDCENACDARHVCIEGVCVAKSEPNPEPQKTCDDDTPCDAGYSCINGECVLPADEDDVCNPVCKAGFTCIEGECVENTASDKPDQNNCNTGNPCDPSAVCVSNYYCVELCGGGKDIYNQIDIIDELGVSQGIEAAKPGFELLKDKDALDTFISNHFLPPIDGIDFGKDAVLAITSGTSGMGIQFKLLKACDVSGTSTFTVLKYYCSTANMVGALEWQWVLLSVPKDGQYDVKFETNDHYCVQ